MLIVGLLLLAAAVLIGVAGVTANTGIEHQITGGFGIFGYHVHTSSGKLVFAALVVGAVGMLGFIMATEGLRRNAELRRELFRFRRQARVRDRAATAAPQPTSRVFARTAPAQSDDTTSTGSDTPTGTGTAGPLTDNPDGESAGWRRGLRNWRTPRPTS